MMGNDCGCGERREYMTLGEYMELYPTAYAEATAGMTEHQKQLFELRFRERLLFLPKDEASEQGETLTIAANVSTDTITPAEDNPTETKPGGTFYWRYTVAEDAEAPTIAVDGAEYIQTAEGSLYVYNVASDVSISVQAALKTYPVTINVENGMAEPTSTTIQARGTAYVSIIPNDFYQFYGVSATGATVTKEEGINRIQITNPTGAVTVSAICTRIVLPLDVTADNCDYSPKYTQVSAGGTYAITFVASSGYTLPEEVKVDGAQYAWKQATGVLTIYNPTSDVFVSVTALTISYYNIAAYIVNGTATGANVIHTGETVALTITANDGYTLPDDVTVTGATGTWNKTTGTLSISNQTGKVFVTAECVKEQTGETWIFNEEVSLTWKTAYTINFKSNNKDFSRFLQGDTYLTYIDANGISDTTPYEYDKNKGKKVWIDETYRTVILESAATGDLLTWLQANAVKQ